MTSLANTDLYAQVEEQNESDYGSDFSPEEEEIVNRILARSPALLEVVEDNPIVNDVEYHEPPSTLRVSRVLGRETYAEKVQIPLDSGNVLPEVRRLRDQTNQNVADSPHLNEIPREEAPPDDQSDKRSPLERFRSPPKKPLSVTDLVSPSWCELQYSYMLNIHGRRKATKEMKGGTVIHEKLEAEIYTTVKVYPQTNEDAWGLRIWNVIQGLKTLEEIGHTRELQVWGTIDGQLVNGIIDEISFTCPDTDLEADTELKEMEKDVKNELAPDQQTITSFFGASNSHSLASALRPKRRAASKKAYICDVKTRSVSSLPKGGAFRPTKMQLMLYHRLLTNLATNSVDFSVILARFKLDGNAPLSDAFVAQIGNLNDGVMFSSSPDSSVPATQDSMTVLLEHNCLNALWALMIVHFQRVLPEGEASVGSVLKAEYRSRQTGEIVGATTFPMDEHLLSVYVEREMQWWKGEREPVGVVIEEAYKCQTCDYADICEWRLARVEEATAKSRQRKKLVGEMKKSLV